MHSAGLEPVEPLWDQLALTASRAFGSCHTIGARNAMRRTPHETSRRGLAGFRSTLTGLATVLLSTTFAAAHGVGS